MLTVCTEHECLTCAHVRSRVHTDTHVRGCAHAHNSQIHARKDQPPEWGAHTQAHTISHALSNANQCGRARSNVYAPLLTHPSRQKLTRPQKCAHARSHYTRYAHVRTCWCRRGCLSPGGDARRGREADTQREARGVHRACRRSPIIRSLHAVLSARDVLCTGSRLDRTTHVDVVTLCRVVQTSLQRPVSYCTPQGTG
jgi:hypothetical protein